MIELTGDNLIEIKVYLKCIVHIVDQFDFRCSILIEI